MTDCSPGKPEAAVTICKESSPARGNRALLYKRHAASRGSGTHAGTMRGRHRKTSRPTYYRVLQIHPRARGGHLLKGKSRGCEGTVRPASIPPPNRLPLRYLRGPPEKRVLENALRCTLALGAVGLVFNGTASAHGQPSRPGGAFRIRRAS